MEKKCRRTKHYITTPTYVPKITAVIKTHTMKLERKKWEPKHDVTPTVQSQHI